MAEETGEAHRAQTLLALAAEAEPHLIGSDDATWMDRLERDHDGLRAAFSWFLKHGKGAEALQLAADLWLFQEQRGHADEARDWLAKSLAAPGAEARTVTRARALYGAGILAFRKLDADAARRAFEECLVIAKERDYVRLIVRANTGMARLALRRGDTKEVRKWSEAGLAIARTRGEKADAVTPLHMLAAAARVDGDIGQARQFYRENLGLNRELGRLEVVSVELGNLGALEVLEGNIRRPCRSFGRAWKSHTSEGTGTSPRTNWSGSGAWRWRKGIPRAGRHCSQRPGPSSIPPAWRWIRMRGRNMRRD